MDSATGLEGSMRQLQLGRSPYPERAGEEDCAYYMRTGTCGYGDRCRFNHPRNRPVIGGGEHLEHMGQPACPYFIKTGTCKYGPSCKYEHPRHGAESARPIPLNYYGYPLRPGEKECSYYVRNNHCKFGSTCKFHHPEPGGAPVPSSTPQFYPTAQAPTIANWQVAQPSMLPPPFMQPPYGSMVISPGVAPFPGWRPYPPTVSPAQSPGRQHSVQTGSMYGSSNPLPSSAHMYPGPYTRISSSSAGPSGSSQKEHYFPERPGQLECQYYMRTGDCKFGQTCKYHHPPECRVPRINCVLSPAGHPLRPGVQPCAHYAQRGVCKFGSTCKYDHSIGILSYSPSASSLADIPVAPYPVGFSVTTLAPPSSSSNLHRQPVSYKGSLSVRIALTESMPSGSTGLMFSRSGFALHSTGSSSLGSQGGPT